jgi:hypothetical protein
LHPGLKDFLLAGKKSDDSYLYLNCPFLKSDPDLVLLKARRWYNTPENFLTA